MNLAVSPAFEPMHRQFVVSAAFECLNGCSNAVHVVSGREDLNIVLGQGGSQPFPDVMQGAPMQAIFDLVNEHDFGLLPDDRTKDLHKAIEALAKQREGYSLFQADIGIQHSGSRRLHGPNGLQAVIHLPQKTNEAPIIFWL